MNTALLGPGSGIRICYLVGVAVSLFAAGPVVTRG